MIVSDPNQITSPTAVAVLTHVVRSIVDDPDAVSVEEVEGRNRAKLEVKVGPGDLGRVIASDSRAARDGAFLEIIGQYNPRLEPSGLNIDNDKAVAWLMKGAQPTERVRKLLEISGAWAQFTTARGK